ncbi:MAG: S8 family peptidase [Candidatus Thorarchaeota archaeon]
MMKKRKMTKMIGVLFLVAMMVAGTASSVAAAQTVLYQEPFDSLNGWMMLPTAYHDLSWTSGYAYVYENPGKVSTPAFAFHSLDLGDWSGDSDLSVDVRFRATSNYYGSSKVTHFRMGIMSIFGNTQWSYRYYEQYSRDTGWETKTLTIPHDSIEASNTLVVYFGYWDSWSYNWHNQAYCDYITISSDDGSNDMLDWGVDLVDAERVWGSAENAKDVVTGINGDPVKVALIDTGIDLNHPDLNDNYKGGWNFVENNAYPDDNGVGSAVPGHGTHCAGIIGAEDNQLGVIGVAPRADIYALKVQTSGNTASETIDCIEDWTAAVNWARTHGMDIISMSLGITDFTLIEYRFTFGSDALWSEFLTAKDALYAAMVSARNSGIVIVVSAGNSGVGIRVFPAVWSDQCIVVGSVESNLERSDFSCYGPQLDFVAPGRNIYSTIPDGTYGLKSGTSMACPMVAGVCALILDANPTFTPANVEAALISGATDLGSSGYDQLYGYGLVNAFASI